MKPMKGHLLSNQVVWPVADTGDISKIEREREEGKRKKKKVVHSE